jgi:hypothetical protein
MDDVGCPKLSPPLPGLAKAASPGVPGLLTVSAWMLHCDLPQLGELE